jgi:hypothetical protein
VVQFYGDVIDGGGSTAFYSSDPYKQYLMESMYSTNYELDILESSTAGEIAMAEADLLALQATMDTADAEAAAAEDAANAAMAEGDKLTAQGDEFFRQAFFGENTTNYSDLSGRLKDVVDKGLFENAPTWTALYSMLTSIGVEGLMDTMQNLRKQYPEASSEEILMLLKYDKRYNEPYMKRFEGNRARIAAGLAPLDDATYLANEAAYKKIFDAYGLNQFANRAKYASFIGNNVSPDEIANRVQLVYDRVTKAMPEVTRALTQFYPELTTVDLMAYALDPTNQLPALNRKIQAAEIGGAALAQKLSTSLTAATFTGAEAAPFSNISRGTIGVESMMQSGADAASAAKASQYVANVLPRGEFLSSIYASGYDQYGQLQAEQEAYQGLASAERARQRLAGREVAAFRGSAGTSRVSLTSETRGLI